MPDRPRRLYAYQQAVRRQLDTQVAGFSGERTGVIELAFNRVFNLPNITVDIRPAGPCRLGIALPGRFTVTFRFSTAAFRRVLAVRRPPNRSLTSSDCFAASAAAFFLASAAAFLAAAAFSAAAAFFSASAAAFFSASAAAFSQLQRPLSSPRPLRLLLCGSRRGFLRLFRLFLGGGSGGRFFLGFRFGFLLRVRLCLGDLFRFGLRLGGGGFGDLLLLFSLGCSGFRRFCCSAACFCCSAAFCCCSACALASCAAFSCAAKRSFSSSFRRCCCSACFC